MTCMDFDELEEILALNWWTDRPGLTQFVQAGPVLHQVIGGDA